MSCPPRSTPFPYTTLFRSVTAVSDYLRRETLEHFDIQQEIEVIPNFIDPERFRRTNKEHFKRALCPNDEKVLVHVSNFRPVKHRSEEHTSELQSRENLVCR